MSLVEYAVEGSVAVITLDRPPVNALNAELVMAIDDAVTQAEDPAIRAVVVTGAPHFAAGADIPGFVDAFDAGPDERQSAGLSGLVTHLESLAKPTIAAVQGYALGGGLELAMGADFRYLSEDATVGQPEVRLGLIPGAGGTQRLARIVGFQKARSMNMTGRHVKADEALSIGLADKVVTMGDLSAVALEDAARFAAGPTVAYAALKRAMRVGYDLPLVDAIAYEREEFAVAFASDDARIGVAAFLAKEKPGFLGT